MLAGLRDQEEWALVGCKNRKRLHDRGLVGNWGGLVASALGNRGLGEVRGYISPPGLVRLRLWGILQGAP